MPDSIDYNKLLVALKAFDLDAFDTLYLNTRERLFAYSFSILKDEVAAQDLVQDFFIDFWEKKIFLRIESKLVCYIMRAVRNRSIEFRHREEVRKKRHLCFGMFEAEKPELKDKIIIREMGRELDTAMSKLPPMPAKVFQLHYVEEFSYKEIADQLHISPATISNHISKALKILRRELKKS